MALTPLDIQQQRFRICLKGYAAKDVEAFLEKLQADLEEHQRREGTFKRALLHSQRVLDQMQENARRQADVIVAEAETKAEKLLQQAQHRVLQLQDSIAGLKRQRIQAEEEITYVIETHRRMLEAGRESERQWDEQTEKLKVLKPAK